MTIHQSCTGKSQNPNLALSLSVKTSILRELSRAKDKLPVNIVNTQIEYLQLKFTARLESRFHEKTKYDPYDNVLYTVFIVKMNMFMHQRP